MTNPAVSMMIPVRDTALALDRTLAVTVEFDYAPVGAAAAAVTRRTGWQLATVPYLCPARNRARQLPTRAPLCDFAGAPIVEAATFAALATGSLAWRSAVQ